MSTKNASGGLPFIVSTGDNKTDSETRKLIRRHVMLGKNQGKTRPVKPKHPRTGINTSETSQDPIEQSSLIQISSIPKRVGSDMSFVEFADTAEPSIIANVIKFSSMAKKTMFSLEQCIIFDKKDTSWFEPLTFDPAYFHAMIFGTQAYLAWDLRSADPTIGRIATFHLIKTIEILRKRLLLVDGKEKLSNPTIKVVLTLAAHSTIVGDEQSAKHHMAGLCKIVALRGGIASLLDSPKLLIEILRCDIGLALHNGTIPFFDNFTGESFLEQGGSCEYILPDGINDQNHRIWSTMKGFCSLINTATETNTRLPQETFLNTMAAVMYPLLRLHFEPGYIDETIRLGLLAFSAHVFLQWQDVKIPYLHLSTTYRDCLKRIQSLDLFPPNLMIWLLMVGRISVFTSDDNPWLKPWLRGNMYLSGIKSWEEIHDILDSYMWIELIHDKPGREIFDSITTEDYRVAAVDT